MSGIAGIARPGGRPLVDRMLNKIAHRGGAGREIQEIRGITFGTVWSSSQPPSTLTQMKMAQDGPCPEHGVSVHWVDGQLALERDALGVTPLYYGHAEDGALCFASEVKALLEATSDIREFPPGCRLAGARMTRYFQLHKQRPMGDSVEIIADQLRQRLQTAVQKRISKDECGAWLSGGLDSSAIAALARPHVKVLHTIVAGLSGAPDLEHARIMAEFIKSRHHEVIVGMDDMLRVLPDVIYHLESFDPLLIRSSVTHYLAAKAASDYAGEVFSGEGGDELFAGYDYLKSIDIGALDDELIDITNSLHNTALQRVDRCASTHGLIAHICFLDPDVVDYALQIPVELKLRNKVEKWILRESMKDLLPEGILRRKKAKFWEGAGVEQLFANYAEKAISDHDFNHERVLPNGWTLNSKEEFMYYRIFYDYFGACQSLDWMGRTKLRVN